MRMERATRRGGPGTFRGLAIFYEIAPSEGGEGGDYKKFRSRRSRIFNNSFYAPFRMMKL